MFNNNNKITLDTAALKLKPKANGSRNELQQLHTARIAIWVSRQELT
jgi:hypothetical protein